jgi:hypothetical protein
MSSPFTPLCSTRSARTGRGPEPTITGPIRRDPRQPTAAIVVIKSVHSLIFLGMAASILYTLYSGLTNRISRLTGVSIAAVVGEGLVLLMNNMRCPLTDMVEGLGSDHGTVSDIFLPKWFADRIPILFTPPFAIGLAAIGLRRARRQPPMAVIAAILAILFLGAPWLLRERNGNQSAGATR